MADKILRLPEVVQLTGKSKTQLYASMKSGDFPVQIQLSKRCVGWRDSEIQAWISSRPKAHARTASNGCAK